MMNIAVYPTIPSLEMSACHLAHQLHLPTILKEDEANAYDYLLLLTPDYLGFKKNNCGLKPFYIDFLSQKMRHRLKHLSLKNESLARALGLKRKAAPLTIVDATGGLGRDSFILASLGYELTVLERSPIIHALLEDALKRAVFFTPIAERITLYQKDAIEWFKKASKPDIIYLDPMFPTKKKSALNQQAMRYLQEIVGEDIDQNDLLEKALACALLRVVVKRPRIANYLAGKAPNYSLIGKSNRFDVYII